MQLFKTDEEKKKAAADKLKVDEKTAAEKLRVDKKAKADKLEADKKIKDEKLKADCVDKKLKIKLPSGAEFEGLCTGTRSINGGAQVFLKLNGLVSRYFNIEDVVK